MIRRNRRQRAPQANEPFLFSAEEMAAMLATAEVQSPEPVAEVPQRDTETVPGPEGKVEDTEQSMAEAMLTAMRLFDAYYTPSQVRLIAMESATLAQKGIHKGKSYELPAIKDRIFDSTQLIAVYYVSFARSFPSMIERINLPYSDSYADALTRYDAEL